MTSSSHSYRVFDEGEAVASSQETTSSRTSGGSNCSSKPRKHPSVTPNTFRRFFTPRSSLSRRRPNSSARQALRDITTPSNNRSQGSSQRRLTTEEPFPDISARGNENALVSLPIEAKKRRSGSVVAYTAQSPSKSKKRRLSAEPIVKSENQAISVLDATSEGEDPLSQGDAGVTSAQSPLIQPIKRLSFKSLSTRVLQRSLGPRSITRVAPNAARWQFETENFHCRPADGHVCTDPTQQEYVLPFCTASCNTNSLVAIGDEDGGIRLLESGKDGKPGFSEPYLHFMPHYNAILDLAFSSDDLLLATASGDQSAQVIDMPTRRVISTIAGHSSSVKQVRFQPGHGMNNVLATSSRDGSVQIWDLRCKGIERPASELYESPEHERLIERLRVGMSPAPSNWARPINSFFDAHADSRWTGGPHTRLRAQAAVAAESRHKTDNRGRQGEVSITALEFLPAGREHLFLTASEANACVKLWDLRSTQRQKSAALSTTRQPESHDRYRNFGINSLSLSGDGGRFYSLCRDNTVYAYSTNHLILGHAPELSNPAARPRRNAGSEGLGPMYGFRHPQFFATTFFVKSSLRKARGDNSEMLAVGSSAGCAVLFPTDESYLQRGIQNAPFEGLETLSARPESQSPTPNQSALRRANSGMGASARLKDTIPIYDHGTALVRGHEREVSSVCWTSEGELISVGDDFAVRCWREGSEARDLRKGGEQEGRRWQSGWADVVEEDEEDD
ncbi:MAG: hypothetical protein M4579_004503 [Chaenotheca gracillima]|nr:MAG: hypothetical protein M4579_004503 [Chaenotheca gracillima]